MDKRGGGFRSITLSDTSEWILREGADPEAYVHIHPGRYSPHTFRVKATSLKIAVCAIYLDGKPNSLDTAFINNIRTGILNLSPVKEYVSTSSTARMIRKLSEFIPAGK
jgi:hypothetical protein